MEAPETRMDSRPTGRWAQIRKRSLVTEADRQQYEQTKRTVIFVRQLLQRIDAERERAGLTKADLAERIGASPASVRRLFTSPSANPTLRTVVELFDALGLEVQVQRRAHESEGVLPPPADQVPSR
jgi:ribosome-binding protein aMBF1 (putative translation factor)